MDAFSLTGQIVESAAEDIAAVRCAIKRDAEWNGRYFQPVAVEPWDDEAAFPAQVTVQLQARHGLIWGDAYFNKFSNRDGRRVAIYTIEV